MFTRFSHHLGKNLRDWRFLLLSVVVLTMFAIFIKPSINRLTPVYDFIFVVDITRSMNARDYRINDSQVSRLDAVKYSLRQFALDLPCGSKMGLAIFSDRQSSLLFEPLDICKGRNDLDRVIAGLDWRMAWAADSRIAQGLFKTIEMLKTHESLIVFITDGQEAPPLNPRYKPDFNAFKNKVDGVILGVGGLHNVPIPKYDSSGKEIGVYQPVDVPHRSTFGIPGRLPEHSGNYHARNAPFGGASVTGDQHQSRLYEGYLRQMSKELGWFYQRLDSEQAWQQKLLQQSFPEFKEHAQDIRQCFALFALLLMGIIHLPIVVNIYRHNHKVS